MKTESVIPDLVKKAQKQLDDFNIPPVPPQISGAKKNRMRRQPSIVVNVPEQKISFMYEEKPLTMLDNISLGAISAGILMFGMVLDRIL